MRGHIPGGRASGHVWRWIEAAIDSGATDIVGNPDDFPGILVENTPESSRGEHWTCVAGKQVPKLGEMKVEWMKFRNLHDDSSPLCTKLHKKSRKTVHRSCIRIGNSDHCACAALTIVLVCWGKLPFCDVLFRWPKIHCHSMVAYYFIMG